MKILITSTSDDAKEILEKLGILAKPGEQGLEGFYELEIDSLEDLLLMPDIIDYELIIRRKDHSINGLENNTGCVVVEIYNDYREGNKYD